MEGNSIEGGGGDIRERGGECWERMGAEDAFFRILRCFMHWKQ